MVQQLSDAVRKEQEAQDVQVASAARAAQRAASPSGRRALQRRAAETDGWLLNHLSKDDQLIVREAILALSLTSDKVFLDPAKASLNGAPIGNHAIRFAEAYQLNFGIYRDVVRWVSPDGHAHNWLLPEQSPISEALLPAVQKKLA